MLNAGKFVLSQTGEVVPITAELDRAFVAKLKALVASATANHEVFQYANALQETESFFWTHFTDTYLELAKNRARAYADSNGLADATGNADVDSDHAFTAEDVAMSGSAVASLRLGLSVLTRLFAPVLPYITDEIWSWSFAAESEGDAATSVHAAAWPGEADFAAVAAPAHEASFDVAVAALGAINKAKADAEVSMGREVNSLVLAGAAESLAVLEGVATDVLAAARVAAHRFEAKGSLGAGEFEVVSIDFAEKPERSA